MRDVAAERSTIEAAIAGKTLCSVFADTVAARGEAEALIGRAADGSYRTVTWNQYRAQVREVALGLAALGFARGAFGVIMARNRPEH